MIDTCLCRYPGTTFMDHVMRFQKNDDVKMIVVLGEVGGTEEYKIVQVRYYVTSFHMCSSHIVVEKKLL